MKDKRFNGILVKRRSYYPKLDVLFDNKEADLNFTRIAINDKNIIQMLISGRTDYTVEYPYVANYLASQYQSKYKTKLGSIAIEELPAFGVSQVACPNTQWGQKVVEAIDKILDKVLPTQEYLKIAQSWHSDPNELEIIKQIYTQQLLQK